ncbi:FAD dependent oxidoreductase [Cesiribacter andamanensis AMV16]|uniref:FAD dependent oxidoreductase n=1 Tax=Cesiribacter andamanensis AMV16 TaxID=1279009 RepID=M7N3Z3_9BACT|nr:FAD dependent oxidoreductase [Cesiribacter andamanensis AMV16]
MLVIEPGSHIGGMTTGGLGATDIGNKQAVTGLARRFYRDLGAYYGTFESWKFEPKAASQVFNRYIKQENIEILPVAPLVEVVKEGAAIRQILVHPSGREAPIAIQAKVFLDCSYEGDLMAMAGISYTVGRESNELYGETYNGVQLLDGHQFPDGISPYRRAGNPDSGLLWGISDRQLDPRGSGDSKVQAYNFRLTLTDSARNRIPITRPRNYDVNRYELLLRLIRQTANHNLYDYFIWTMLPRRKTDINNRGGFSTDMIGFNWEYPEANWEKRREIIQLHEEYTRGLLYFLGNDPRVPEVMRQEMKKWGLPRDEFINTNHFTPQLYVREARRMLGEYVMTEHNCTGATTVEDGIALAAYTMDSHHVQRVVVDGMVKNEGNVEVGNFPPYPISYRALVPRPDECSNLLVPVALSASHIAYGSIRMEPVFMVLGQVAAMAASLAIDQKKTVQSIRLRPLQTMLQNNPYLDGTPPDIVVDNSDPSGITIAGQWDTVSHWMGQYKQDYLLSRGGGGTQPRRVSFTATAAQDGNYMLYLSSPRGPWVQEEPYARKVPVEITAPQGTATRTVDMEQKRNDWIPLGNYLLKKGQRVQVSILADGLTEPVAADALLLVNTRDVR